MDVSADGTVYVAGTFSGGLQIGGQTKPAIDAQNAYVASIAADGSVNWVYTVGSTTYFVTWGVAAGPTDHEVYAVVTSDTVIDYGDGMRPSGTTLLRIVNGAVANSLALGPAYLPGVRVAGGHLYLAGAFTGSIDWGTGTKSSQGDDVVLAKLDLGLSVGSDGWVKTFGSAGDDGAFALDVDATGNVFFGGAIGGSVDFGGGAEFFSSHQDAFIAKLDPSGNYLGAITESGVGGTEAVWSLGVDNTGAVVATGRYDADLNVKGKTLAAGGQNSMFVIRWAWSGSSFSERWGVGFGDTTAAGFGRTHLDSAGRPVVAGTAIASILLGQDTLPPVPDGLPFIARFDENGNHAWHLSLGDAAGGSLAAVGQSSAGEVHLVGSTNSPTLDIGTGAITAGQGKSFVMSWDASCSAGASVGPLSHQHRKTLDRDADAAPCWALEHRLPPRAIAGSRATQGSSGDVLAPRSLRPIPRPKPNVAGA